MKTPPFVLFFLFTCLFSCKKEEAINVNSGLIGIWYHYEPYEHGVRFKRLTLQSDGKGEIWYSNGWKVYGGTKTRKWLIKDEHLYFGRTASGNEKFEINQYPEIADSTFTIGLDTISSGEKYMILDDTYFCDFN